MSTAHRNVPGIISLDLDGTVLASDHKTITPRTYSALTECLSQGTYIVPNTGRCEALIPVRDFPGVRYVISCNGGLITDQQTQRILRARYLKKTDVLEVWNLVRSRVYRHNILMELFEEKQLVVEKRVYENLDLFRPKIPRFHLPLIESGRAKYVDSFDSYLRGEGDKVTKINFPGKNLTDCPELRQELTELNRFEVTSDGLNLELTARGCTKGEALLWLGDYLGIPPQRIVAFGDGNNDMTMLQAAGYGVAMGNAASDIREAVSYVTTPNTEDGVAAFLEKFLASEIVQQAY